MFDELKPTNEEIAKYILKWINMVENEVITKEEILLFGGNFTHLRSLFEPVMYDSIQEYVDKEK
jgi:hypothetical protein